MNITIKMIYILYFTSTRTHNYNDSLIHIQTNRVSYTIVIYYFIMYI